MCKLVYGAGGLKARAHELIASREAAGDNEIRCESQVREPA